MDALSEFVAWENAMEEAKNCKPKALAQLIRDGHDIPANYREGVAEVLMNPQKNKAGRPKSGEHIISLLQTIYWVKRFPSNGKPLLDKVFIFNLLEEEIKPLEVEDKPLEEEDKPQKKWNITEESVKSHIGELKKTDRFKRMDEIYKKYPKFLNEKIEEMKIEMSEDLYDMIYKEFLEQHFVDTISVKFETMQNQ